ncbi:MAG: hypothetical protein IPK28_00130 [Devosia sp.]|nr:hypothetical protein [Devosia sp.]
MGQMLDSLARMLAGAHRDPTIRLNGELFAELDFWEAQQVQALTLQLLADSVPVSKVAIDGEGRAVAAPIYGSLVARSGDTIDLPQRGWLGIEVEIAARLGRTLTPALAAGGAEAVLASVESFHVGIEIVGSRFADRLTAGPNGGFADNMNSAGYIWSQHAWTGGTEIDGLPITVAIDGETSWQGTAKAPFGKLLDPIIAYANTPLAFRALQAGMLVTAGTLCGLVEVGAAPRQISATFANAPAVTFAVRQPSA